MDVCRIDLECIEEDTEVLGSGVGCIVWRKCDGDGLGSRRRGEGGVDDEEIARLMKMASEGEARAAESGGGSVAARVWSEDEGVDGVVHGSKVVEIGWKDV